MRSVPLFTSKAVPSIPWPEDTCPECDARSTRPPSAIRPIGEAGNGENPVLCVVGFPTARDTDAGVLSSAASAHVQRIVRSVHRGAYVVAPAAPCSPADPKQIEHFRAHIESLRKSINASTVLCFGVDAQAVVMGEAYHPASARRSYRDFAGFRAHAMLDALDGTNKLLREWLTADVRHALGADPGCWFATPFDVSAKVVETEADAFQLLEDCQCADHAMLTAFDAETVGETFTRNFRVVSWAVAGSIEGREFVYVFDRGLGGRTSEAAFGMIEAYFLEGGFKKLGANVKYDIIAAKLHHGLDVTSVVGDVRLWRKILQPDAAADLDVMSGLVGMYAAKSDFEAELLRVKKHAVKAVKAGERPFPGMTDDDIALVKDPDVGFRTWAYGFTDATMRQQYVARDALATFRLGLLFTHETTPGVDRLHRVWGGTLEKAAAALVKVECNGMPVDRDAVSQLDSLLALRIDDLTQRFSEYPGLNPSSNKSVGEYVFGKLGIRPSKYTKKGAASVSADALEEMKGKHSVIDLILEYRTLSKLKGTYAEGLLRAIREDGRVHPSIKADGAETGRFSCTDPNLQNIPRADTELGRMIRECFVAPQGWSFLEADFNQLELRIAAMLSQDEIMSAIFIANEDFHKRTAQLIAPVAWHTRAEDVTDEQRSWAKAANFGGMYGQGPRALAEKLGITKELAAKIQNAILGNFKGYAKWKVRMLANARATGSTETWWAGGPYRSRPLPALFSHDDAAVSRAQNGSTNTPIQGTGSEFCVASLGAVQEWIDDDGVPAQIIMAIHDSILLLVKDTAIQEVAYHVPRIMCSFDSGNVPLRADVKVGKTWGSMKKLEGKVEPPSRKRKAA